jgi:hypothetical protein
MKTDIAGHRSKLIKLVLMDGLGTLHKQEPCVIGRISELFQDNHRYV